MNNQKNINLNSFQEDNNNLNPNSSSREEPVSNY